MEDKRQENIFVNKRILSSTDSGVVNLRERVREDSKKKVDKQIPKEAPKGKKRESINRSFNVLDRMIEIGIYLLVFTMPLFVLSFSYGTYEFDKVTLMTFFSGILLLLWTINGIFVKKRFVIAKSKITVPFFAFVLIMAISGLLGVDKVSSFLGYYGNFSDSVIFFVDLFVFYVITTSLMVERGAGRMISMMVKSVLISSLVVILLSLSYYAGTDFLSYKDAATAFNLVSGDGTIFSIYLSAIVLLAFYDFFSSSRFAVIKRIVDVTIILLAAFNLILIGWPLVWLLLFVLMLIAVAVNMVSSDKKAYGLGLKALMIVSILLFLIMSLSGVNRGNVDNRQPLFKESLVSSYLQEKLETSSVVPADSLMADEIALQSIEENPLFGSGVGTYYYDFLKYKNVDFNNETNWTVRMSKAYNEFLERVSTTGVLGSISYIIFVLSAVYVGFVAARKRKRDAFLLVAFLAIVVSQFAYADSAAVKFLFVVLLVVISGKRISSEEENKFSDSDAIVYGLHGGSSKSGVALVLSVVSLIIALILPLYAVQSYRADIKYRELSESDLGVADISELESVVSMNPFRGEYESGLSLMYISKLSILMNSMDLSSADEASVIEAQNIAERAVDHARRAVEISPNNANFWENYAYVYKVAYEENMPGADEWVIRGMTEAINLDPNNTILYTELGKMYMLQYDALTGEERAAKLSNAEESFKKAVELKEDYSEAIVELAGVYFEKGDSQAALEQLDVAKKKQLSVQIATTIGKLYFNLGENDDAIEILEAVNAFDSDNANAHYILGMTYKDEERYSEALNEFRIALRVGEKNGAADESLIEDVRREINELEGKVINTDKSEDTVTEAEIAESEDIEAEDSVDMSEDAESEEEVEE